MKTVLITTSSFGASEAVERSLQKLRGRGFKTALNPFGRTLTEAELASLITEFDPVGIIAGVEPIGELALGNAHSLKVISRCGVDTGNVLKALTDRLGIAVSNTPDAPTEAVAELTIALMLNLIRKVGEADRTIRAGGWKKYAGRSLSGMTIGILGCGRIGSKVASYLRPFKCDILGADKIARSIDGVTMTAVDRLIKSSDLITLHLPAIRENENMVNRAFIGTMKEGSFIVNTARGELIDEDALVEGLEKKKLAGAALDTFKKEPYKGKLVAFDNVLLTSHMGSYAREARVKMEIESVENIIKDLEAGI